MDQCHREPAHFGQSEHGIEIDPGREVEVATIITLSDAHSILADCVPELQRALVAASPLRLSRIAATWVVRVASLVQSAPEHAQSLKRNRERGTVGA